MAATTPSVSERRAPARSRRGSAVLEWLVGTDARVAPALARLGLGIVVFPHAAQKVFGWFGGPGLDGALRFYGTLGVAPALGVLAMLTEMLGALALIFGLFTRLAAIGIAAIMVGAIALVHAPYGFFMNWQGAKAGEGFEYHLLALTLAAVCFFAGGGLGSIDLALARSVRDEPRVT